MGGRDWLGIEKSRMLNFKVSRKQNRERKSELEMRSQVVASISLGNVIGPVYLLHTE